MKDFLFGTATSSVQIEGGHDQGGKGWSIWDEYSKKGLIQNKHTCFTACDSYNRLDEDLALLKELGATAYRFSLAWPRIQPKGYGKINPEGIAYYNKLIDGLLKIGVTPFVTLYHWDMPIELDERGAFSNREIVERFEEYAKIVAENFGDRVEYFSVFNEAAAIIDFMYLRPVGQGYPPKSNQEAYEAIHNLLLCNGAATRALRKYSKKPVKVGMVNCTGTRIPDEPKWEELAYRESFAPELFGNCAFWDPVVFGKYNEKWVETMGVDLSFIQDGDMEKIQCEPDFYGLNVYGGKRITGDENGNAVYMLPSVNATLGNMGGPYTDSSEAVYYGAKFMRRRYGNKPVFITESGCDSPDVVDCNGEVLDGTRAEVIRRYLAQAVRANKEGLEVNGYFVWSLMDNFEWSSGYTRRFGIVYSDYVTGKRTPKHSYYVYKDLIKKYKE